MITNGYGQIGCKRVVTRRAVFQMVFHAKTEIDIKSVNQMLALRVQITPANQIADEDALKLLFHLRLPINNHPYIEQAYG
ncbi:hypothetical protein, partial [Pseudomonas amygdali]